SRSLAMLLVACWGIYHTPSGPRTPISFAPPRLRHLSRSAILTWVDTLALDDATLHTALELLTLPVNSPQIESLDSAGRRALSSHRRWVRGPGVVGWGISFRVTSGALTNDPAFTVYVEEKRAKSDVPQGHRIPPSVDVPTLGVSVPVDVRAIGR